MNYLLLTLDLSQRLIIFFSILCLICCSSYLFNCIATSLISSSLFSSFFPSIYFFLAFLSSIYLIKSVKITFYLAFYFSLQILLPFVLPLSTAPLFWPSSVQAQKTHFIYFSYCISSPSLYNYFPFYSIKHHFCFVVFFKFSSSYAPHLL